MPARRRCFCASLHGKITREGISIDDTIVGKPQASRHTLAVQHNCAVSDGGEPCESRRDSETEPHLLPVARGRDQTNFVQGGRCTYADTWNGANARVITAGPGADAGIATSARAHHVRKVGACQTCGGYGSRVAGEGVCEIEREKGSVRGRANLYLRDSYLEANLWDAGAVRESACARWSGWKRVRMFAVALHVTPQTMHL